MIRKNQLLTAGVSVCMLFTVLSSNAQVKLLKSVRDNMSDQQNSDVALAKYDIDKVLLHPDTKDMCATFAWQAAVYSSIANSGDSLIRNLDKDNTAAATSGDALMKFYACSSEEREKLDGNTAADFYLIYVISACWNEAVYASQNANSFESVKRHMTLVDQLIPYDSKEEKAKNASITREKALYEIWKSAFKDSLVNEEIIYLEKLMEIPSYMNSYIYVRMAQILSDKKEYDKALTYLDKGKEKIPQKAGDFLDMQINIEIERGNMVALLAKLNESIETNPDNPQYYFARGVSYHKLKDEELKEQDLAGRKNIAVKPSVYFYSQGLKDYRKALELDPGFFDALKNEAILLFDSANYIYKMRIRVPANEYDKYDRLSIAIYKQALEKFEALRASGALKDQELVNALKDMKTICVKIGDTEGRAKYDAMLKSEQQKLKDKGM